MSKIIHIKPFYEPADVQNDLREDGLTLMAMNITSTFRRYNKRLMNQKEVDKITKLFYDRLMVENNLAQEWDQTS